MRGKKWSLFGGGKAEAKETVLSEEELRAGYQIAQEDADKAEGLSAANTETGYWVDHNPDFTKWADLYHVFKNEGLTNRVALGVQDVKDFRWAKQEEFVELIEALPNSRTQLVLLNNAFRAHFWLTKETGAYLRSRCKEFAAGQTNKQLTMEVMIYACTEEEASSQENG